MFQLQPHHQHTSNKFLNTNHPSLIKSLLLNIHLFILCILLSILLIFIVEMRKQNKLNRLTETKQLTKSRKQLRKQKKQAKKLRIKHYFKNQPQKQSLTKSYVKKPSQKINKEKGKSQTIVVKDKKKAEKQKKAVLQENEDDKIIKLYQQKLGLNEGKDKYNKIAKKYGFDDDIFAFLDGISKKVGTSDPSKKTNQEKEQNIYEESQGNGQEGLNRDEQDQSGENIDDDQNEMFDEEYDQMFNNLDQIEQEQMGEDEQQLQEQQQMQEEYGQQIEQQGQQINQQDLEQQNEGFEAENTIKEDKSQQRPTFFKKDTSSAQQKQVRRSMNALFNKLSDGNILLSFRQFVKIIESYPRSLAIPIYSDLFTRFNLLIEKPLFHILATNIALASALHYAFGNRLMAPLIHAVTTKFISISKQGENEEEVSQFGYSKKFQRMKNYAIIISFLYSYQSITGDFLESFVGWLVKSLNRYNIELLYIIVQKCGIKIRQNDPSTLKNIIISIKDSIANYKTQHKQGEQIQKINFIQAELSDIKFNKKAQNNPDQRMAFLQTFIYKNVPKEIQTEKQMFMLKFEELINIDISRTTWWQRDNWGTNENEEDNKQEQDFSQVAAEKRKLLQLAKTFHMVTEMKKNIFICLMDSKDFLQATQRILELKIKNYQDVATVLVQVCTLQPSFNPYYALVASKIASVMPKFRLNLQYAIWDHLKLIHSYELRRTSNLAKFAAKLISDSLSNSSLSILKFYPELSNIRAIDATFLNIFFSYFFKKVKKEYLSKLVSKLREQNNRSIKQGIKQYLSQFQCEEKIQEKVKLCRRLLLVELDQRQLERGDDD